MPLSEANAGDFLSYLSSLGMLETNVSLLYHAIAEKTEDSNAKRHLRKISQDGAEHAKLLKGVASFVKIPDQISVPNQGKKVEAMERTTKLSINVQALGRIGGIEFSQLFEDLINLENTLSEEYMNLTEVSLPLALQQMVSGMSNDELQHQQVLRTIKFILSPNKAERRENTPVVKYTNPDSWRG
jgi:hypothetical protein